MILCLLSCVYQTCDMISVYHVYIISNPYPVPYHILSLSYHVHQTDPKGLRSWKHIRSGALHIKGDIHVLEQNREQSTSVWEIERIEKKKATDCTTRRKDGNTLGDKNLISYCGIDDFLFGFMLFIFSKYE